MSWWLGTCRLVPSSALQQRTPEKLFNLLCLSFPLGKQIVALPFLVLGFRVKHPPGDAPWSCQEQLWGGGRTWRSLGVPVTGRVGAGMESGAASSSARGFDHTLPWLVLK